MFTELLFHAKLCPKCTYCLLSHLTPLKLLFADYSDPYFIDGDTDTRRLRDLPKVTLITDRRAGICSTVSLYIQNMTSGACFH